MAVTGAIPLPESGIEAFDRGLTGSQDILNRIIANRQKQQELQQTGQYHQGLLDIYKQQEERKRNEEPLNLDLLKAKIQHYKNGGYSSSGLTKPVITLNQKTIQSIDNIIPQVDKLLSPKSTVPGQLIGKYLHPSNQTKYEADIAKITDNLLGALQLPKTNQSLKLAEKMIRQGKFESDEDYKARLQDLKQDLYERKNRAMENLNQGNVSYRENMPEEPSIDQSYENTSSNSDIENGIATIIDPSGKEHKIYRDNIDAALKKYPGARLKKEKFNNARI